MKTLTILVLGLCFIVPSLHAQDEGASELSQAYVQLKNGSKVQGEILEWVMDDYILLKMPWGSTLRIESDNIKKVIQSTNLTAPSPIYNFQETGLYYSAKAGVISGNEGNRAKGVYGFTLSASAGHRFNRFLGVGGGLGFDRYVWASAEDVIPIFAELSGYVSPTNTSLSYNLQVGYGFVGADTDYLLTEAEGGAMIYPSIGIRFGQENTKVTMDLGYKFQWASYNYRDIWTATTRSEQEVLYKRLTLRFGILL
ncbi:MAG: hypothetical protein KJN84_09235 [Bacteroidia bacterium]|nr:hypothetical protein [Bacteroidia bacterium]